MCLFLGILELLIKQPLGVLQELKKFFVLKLQGLQFINEDRGAVGLRGLLSRGLRAWDLIFLNWEDNVGSSRTAIPLALIS